MKYTQSQKTNWKNEQIEKGMQIASTIMIDTEGATQKQLDYMHLEISKLSEKMIAFLQNELKSAMSFKRFFTSNWQSLYLLAFFKKETVSSMFPEGYNFDDKEYEKLMELYQVYNFCKSNNINKIYAIKYNQYSCDNETVLIKLDSKTGKIEIVKDFRKIEVEVVENKEVTEEKTTGEDTMNTEKTTQIVENLKEEIKNYKKINEEIENYKNENDESDEYYNNLTSMYDRQQWILDQIFENACNLADIWEDRFQNPLKDNQKIIMGLIILLLDIYKTSTDEKYDEDEVEEMIEENKYDVEEMLGLININDYIY